MKYKTIQSRVKWEEEIEKWNSLISLKYRGRSCLMCGLSKKGLYDLCKKVEKQTKQDTRMEVLREIRKLNKKLYDPIELGIRLDKLLKND